MKYKKAFVNGTIYTVDNSNPYAQSVITAHDKIVFVGSNTDAKEHIDKFTEVIDLQGKLMLPGFIDSHAHTILGGFSLLSVDLRDCKSKNEFINTLAAYVQTCKNKWVTGGNWNHQIWDVPELPTRNWIDDFSENTPVFLMRMDYHMALANSKALALAGITKHTVSPIGGLIVKDSLTGEPTGILKDKAMELVQNVIPEPTDKEYDRAINAAMHEANRFGITSINDITYKNQFKVLQRTKANNKLTCRISSNLPIEYYKNLAGAEVHINFGDNTLKIGALKAFADGSLGSETAYFFEPYANDSTNCGLPMEILSSGELELMMIEADKNNYQLCIHTIGDRAMSDVLDIVEKMVSVNPKWDRRFRIEHAQHIHPKDFERCKNLDVILSIQPAHLLDDAPTLRQKLCADSLKYAYPIKDFIDHGIRVCFGSDWAVASLNPLIGIYAAVTRNYGGVNAPTYFEPFQKISIENSIKAYTLDGAYASYWENFIGSIEVGKLADLVILDENILSLDKNEILDTKVNTTILGGELVYSS